MSLLKACADEFKFEPKSVGDDITFFNGEASFYAAAGQRALVPGESKPSPLLWILYDGEIAHTYTLKRMVEAAVVAGARVQMRDVRRLRVSTDATSRVALHYDGVRLAKQDSGNAADEVVENQLPSVVLSRIGAMRVRV